MNCRICDSQNLESVLDLGSQPWANNFLSKEKLGTEEKYPLRLLYCLDCSCVQLDYTVPKEVMFSEHTYVSGTTKTLSDHFYETAKTLISNHFPQSETQPCVLDIGSNDGSQLLQYQKLGWAVQGVESCGSIARLAEQRGVPTLNTFFNEDCLPALNRQFEVINASGVFFHLEELHSAARAVKKALKEKGIFVVQFLYMKSIVENLAFDQIYHEHLLYYTLKTLNQLLKRHGLEAFDCYLSPIHGGSIILYASHTGSYSASEKFLAMLAEEERSGANTIENYQRFSERVAQMKIDTLEYLTAAKRQGKTIFGLGAPVKGNTFLNYCGIGSEYLDCLVERNPLRKGLYSPGMHLEVLMEEELTSPPDIYLVLAWNFRKEILERNKELIAKGVEFYFPVIPPDSV